MTALRLLTVAGGGGHGESAWLPRSPRRRHCARLDSRRLLMNRCLLLLIGLLLATRAASAADDLLPPGPWPCDAAQPAVHREGFVTVGGLQQWVTVHGGDCRKPVLLMVHGGPGNPLTPYANAPASPYAAWQQDFTLVLWDQRGAGRTYGRQPVDPDAEEQLLSIEQLAADGVEVARWATRTLGQRQVVLFGGSWSSALSVHMAMRAPELFVAYVGTGQLVGADNLPASYAATLALARAAGDAASVAKLEAMGAPPWTNPRHMGQLRRVTRIYEAAASDPAPTAWWQRSPAYDTPAERETYTRGEDFSWLQYVGLRGQGMLSRLDLPALGLRFAMPVFMLQGEADLVTVPAVSRRYFDRLQAPAKHYLLLPRVGHDPNPRMIAAQHRVLVEQVLPLLAR